MSLNLRTAFPVPAALALAALVAMPSSADAATASSLSYRCKFPLVGVQRATVDVRAEASGETVDPKVAFDVDISIGGTFATSLRLIDGLSSLQGASNAFGKGSALNLRVIENGGQPYAVRAPLAIDPLFVDATGDGPVVFHGSASSPLPASGTDVAKYLESINLNFDARDAQGQPVEGLVTPSTGVGGEPFTDSDRQPGQPASEDPTFDVPCKLDPADQDTLVFSTGAVNPGPDTTAPTTPGAVPAQADDIRSSSILLRWGTSTDPLGSGVKEYVVSFQGPNGPQEVRVPAGTTSRLIEGLAPATAYAFDVVAVDQAGNASVPRQINRTTLAVDANVPPTAPGAPTGTTTATSATLSWSPSSDPDGVVARYEVLANGGPVATVTGTTATISSLAPNSQYDFRVVAVDDDGARTLGPVTTLKTASGSGQGIIAYKCKFPLIGLKPVTMDFDVDVPDTVAADEPWPVSTISASITLGGQTASALELIDGLRWIKGINTPSPTKGFTLFAHIERPGEARLPIAVPMKLTPYEVLKPVASPVVLVAKGILPELRLDTPPGTGKIVFDRLQFNLAPTDANGVPVQGLYTPTTGVDGTPFADTDRQAGQTQIDDPTFNLPCALDPAGQNLTLAPFNVVIPGGPVPPPAPGGSTEYVESDFTSSSINVRWSYDAPNPKAFEITYDGPDGSTTVTVPGDTRNLVVSGLGTDAGFAFEIRAVADSGEKSNAFETPLLFINPTVVEPGPPTTPTGLVASAVTTSSVVLNWTASTDADGTVARYNVYRDGTKVAVVTSGTSATITGLAESTSYAFTVEAVDNTDLASPRSAALAVKTAVAPTPPGTIGFSLSGTSEIKTFMKAPVKLTGSFTADAGVSDGPFSANLAFDDATARLLAGGYLPITGKVAFVPAGPTSANLDSDAGVLTTATKVRIKIKRLNLFGAIPLAIGNNCQTRSLSDIRLKSAPGFTIAAGGELSGSYKISDLNGCAVASGLISPLIAGDGNTMKLKFTSRQP